MDTTKKLEIVALDVQNVKRIRAVHIEPDGSTVILGGRNGQGKSSVLDAIMFTLGGGKIPGIPLHEGSERGSVAIDLGDVIVTRTFTEGGGSLQVEMKTGEGRGALIRSPQAWLDAKIGALSFDPLNFLNLKEDRQSDMLRSLAGVDTTELDGRRAKVFSGRTDANRSARDAEGVALSLPGFGDVGTKLITTDALKAELETARKQATAKEEARKAAEAAVKAVDDAKTEFETFKVKGLKVVQEVTDAAAEAKVKVIELKAELEKAEAAAIEADAKVPLTKATLNQIAREKNAKIAELNTFALTSAAELDTMTDGNTDDVLKRFGEIDETNRKIGANIEKEAALKRFNEFKSKAAALTAEIEQIDAEKEAALSSASFPVEGLAVNLDGRVTFNGLPLEQASQAEKITVSMSIALAANPELKLVLIRDGSLLDEDSLKQIVEMAEAAGAQVWIERVGDRDPGAVIIEDGAVRAVTK